MENIILRQREAPAGMEIIWRAVGNKELNDKYASDSYVIQINLQLILIINERLNHIKLYRRYHTVIDEYKPNSYGARSNM